MFSHIGLTIAAFVLMAVGAAGVILPFLPGVPVAWLGLFGYAHFTSYAQVSLKAVMIFLGLTLFTFILDFAAPILGSKKQDASRQGIVGSFLGGILGVAVFGPIGIVIGPFAGAFLGELAAGKTPERGLKSAWGALAGWLAGSIIKLLIIFAMALYLAWALVL